MLPEAFLVTLKARGVDVITPPHKSELARLETLVTGEKFAPVFREFYSQFGGYDSHDNENHIDLWSLDKIVENLDSSKLADSGLPDAFRFHSGRFAR